VRRPNTTCTLGLIVLFALVSLSSSTTRGFAEARPLYAADGEDFHRNFQRLDPSNGSPTLIGDAHAAITGLAFHPTTRVLYGSTANTAVGDQTIPTGALITVSTTTGLSTLVGSFGLGSGTLADLAFDPVTGTLYGWSTGSGGDLYTVNLTTGAATLVGESGLSLSGGNGLTFDESGNLYLAGNRTNGLLRTIDKATGLEIGSVQMSGYPLNQNINALDFDGTSLFGIAKTTNDLIEIDPVSGAITTRGDAGNSLDAIAFAPPASNFGGNQPLYAAQAEDFARSFYRLDAGRVAPTLIGDAGTAITGLAFRPSTGVLYGATGATASIAVGNQTIPSGALVVVDTTSGIATSVGSFGLGGSTLSDLAFDPISGTLYGWSAGAGGDLHTVNLLTGTATLVGESGLTLQGGNGLAIDAAGTLYLAGDGTTGLLHTINKTTGQSIGSVQLTGYPTALNISALAFSGNSLFGITKTSNDLILIDPASGVVTTIGVVGSSIDAIAFAPAAGTNSVPGTISSGGSLALAITGPNPSRNGVVSLSFSLPSRNRATLEILDLSGRRLLAMNVGDGHTGIQRLDVRMPGRLPAGVYLVRLAQNGNSASAKAIRTH